MPDNQQIRVHGIERNGGINECFAFINGGGGEIHIHDIRTEAFPRQFE